MKTLHIWPIFASILVAAAIFLGLRLYTQAQGAAITVCAKHDGLMHVIGGGFKRTACNQNETLLSWNIQGPPGPQGPAGQNLHLFDANGQDLGILVDAEIYFEAELLERLKSNLPLTPSLPAGSIPPTVLEKKLFKTYLSTLGVSPLIMERSRSETAEIVSPLSGGIVFEEMDCTGTAFSLDRTDRVAIAPNMLIRAAGPRYFKFGVRMGALNGQSFLPETIGQPCMNTATSTANGIQLEEVTLPFTEPIAWPLEIRSQ